MVLTFKLGYQGFAGLFVISLLISLVCIAGCGALCSEFYRGETHHLYVKGNRAYRGGEFQKAREHFERVVKMDPCYAQAYAGLGNIALVVGRFQRAEEHYRRAMTLDPRLRENLLARLLVAKEQKRRKALLRYGVDLKKVLILLSSGREEVLADLLSRGVPLHLLAQDAGSLSVQELEKLTGLVRKSAYTSRGSVPVKYFFGLFLMYSHQDDGLALELLENVARDLKGKEKQELHMKLGRLFERRGKKINAVAAYLEAVRAGKPLGEVAPDLARIYGIPAKEIMGGGALSSGKGCGKPKKSDGSVTATGLGSGVVGR
jgi:tetratricopeptide (TPR) repeat protein